MKLNEGNLKVYALVTHNAKYSDDALDVRLVYLENEHPRNFSSDAYRDLKKSDIYYADLGLHAHWYVGSNGEGEWLCHELGYYEPYRVCTGMAEAMARSLRTIQKRTEKLAETLGCGRDFADVVVRFGAAVGVAGYLICRDKERYSSYDDNDYVCLSASGILHHIRQLAASHQVTVSVG